MPFEFAFLDWLCQFRNPVMNAISIFFDYAGAHGEIWIAFTLLLLLFRRRARQFIEPPQQLFAAPAVRPQLRVIGPVEYAGQHPFFFRHPKASFSQISPI